MTTSSAGRRVFSLGSSFAFDGISLDADGGVSIPGRKILRGQDFAVYCGAWFIYRPATDPNGVAVERDGIEAELAFSFQGAIWYQSRIEVPQFDNQDLTTVFPALKRFVLCEGGEVTIDRITFPAEAAIIIEEDQFRVLRAAGSDQPLLLFTASKLPDIYLYQRGRWCEWDSWLPPTELRPPRREPHESFEPHSASEVPGITLYPNGDFTVAHYRYRQDGPDIATVEVGRWNLSKAAGMGMELFLINNQTEDTIAYRYLNQKWHRRLVWESVCNTPVGEVVMFQPGRVHVLPLLERYHHAEPIRCVRQTPAGDWWVKKEEGEREPVSVRSPAGDEQSFVFHGTNWYELVAVKRATPKQNVPTVGLPMRASGRDDDGEKRCRGDWVQRTHPMFGPVRGHGRIGFFLESLPQVVFHFDGQITVGNESFELDEHFDRDYYRTYLAGSATTCLEIWRLPRAEGSEYWKVERFRFHQRYWQRQILAARNPNGFPWGWLQRSKVWGLRNGRRIVDWLDRKFFYD